MKLHEEFKEYETLWDAPALTEEKEFRSEYARLCSTPEGRAQLKAMSIEERQALYKADREVDPVQKVLDAIPDFELEYEGYAYDWYEDHFDPGRDYGHYQTTGTDYVDDFVYSVDATDMFETLRDVIIDKYADKVGKSELLDTYKILEKAWEDSSEENEEEACEAVELFLAKNLEDFFELFEQQVYKYYDKYAYAE
jgi:dsDNA-binding SOS-regulon protein